MHVVAQLTAGSHWAHFPPSPTPLVSSRNAPPHDTKNGSVPDYYGQLIIQEKRLF